MPSEALAPEAFATGKSQSDAVPAPKKSGLRDVISGQLTGVALLTLLPFIINGYLFSPFAETATHAVYLPQAAIALIGLCLITLAVSRDYRFVMCLFSSVILFGMAEKNTEMFDIAQIRDAPWYIFNTLYTFTGALTFVVILRKPTLSTWLFRLVVVLLLADVALSIAGIEFAFLGPLFLAYFPSQVSVLLCLTILAILRMIAKFYLENAETRAKVRRTDPRYMRRVRVSTLKLWWPMLVIFGVFTLAYHLMSEPLVSRPLVTHLDTLDASGKPVHKTALVPESAGPDVIVDAQAPPERTVEIAAQEAVARINVKLQAEFKTKVTKQIDAAGANKAKAMAAAEGALPERFPGTEPSRCGFLDFGCYIQNGIKSMITSAYRSSRASMLAEFQGKLDEIDETAANAEQQIIDAFTGAADNFSGFTQQRIGETATGLRLAGWAALCYSLLILVKSYMIVFARVFCARVATALATPDEDETGPEDGRSGPPVGAMTARGSQHRLDRADGFDRYYVNFRACGNNVVDRRRVPQPLRLIFRRLRARNYAMCLVDFGAGDGITSCDIIVDPPSEIVQWDLKDGDEAFIDMSALVGFTDTCRLSRCFSLSLGALIFGRLIYHSIQGPGRVFLRTKSAPLAGTDPGTSNIMRASSLVAWRRDTEFNVISSLTVGDTFFSGYSVRKADPRDHVVLYDTSQSRRSGASGGILRMTRAFLLPF